MSDDASSTEVEKLLVEAESQGIAVASVDDGTVFTFTAGMLEGMLERARVMGRVVVFVQHVKAEGRPVVPGAQA